MSAEHPADSTLDPTARQVLLRYSSSIRPRSLNRLATGQGFSGARISRVEGEGGLYALRAMPEAAVDVLRLEGLHRLLAHVRDAGVTVVAVPLRQSDGATWCAAAEHVWQLEPWLPGEANFAAQPTPGRLRNALHALARWHQAARSFPATGNEQRWFGRASSAKSPGLTERIRTIEGWTAGRLGSLEAALGRGEWPEFEALGRRIVELFPRAAAAVIGELRLGAALRVPLQPCLRDVWHDHLLFTGEEVTGLIDPHACRTESVATDLARLLGSLAVDNRDMWQAGLAAYAEVRPITPLELGLVELFDRSAVLLNGMSWLDWRYEQQRVFESPKVVVQRFETIVARLETLCERLRPTLTF